MQVDSALISQLEQLTTVINEQIELDQQQREQNLELEKEQQLKLEQEQQLLSQQQEVMATIEQAQLEDTTLFRESILQSLSDVNENLVLLTSAQTASVEMQKDMYDEVLPSVKTFTDFSIFYLCLIPFLLGIRYFGQLVDRAVR